MKSVAVVFDEQKRVALVEIILPDMGPKDLMLRVLVSGVSVGTEGAALTGRRPEMKFPHVPGYLGVGIVEETGREVQDFSAGDRVFFTQCRLPEPYASNSWMGAHLSRAVISSDCTIDPPFVCKVPDGIDNESAALSGLGAVAVRGGDLIPVTSGHTAVIVGLGIIGQCSAQVLRAKGARVIVADRIAQRVQRASDLGADAAITLDAGIPIAEQVRPFLTGGRADIVVDATGSPAALAQLAPLLRERGWFLLQGYYPGQTPMDLHTLHCRSAHVLVPCGYDRNGYDYCGRMVGVGALKLSSMITHRFPYIEAPAAYKLLLEKPGDFLGMILTWGHE